MAPHAFARNQCLEKPAFVRPSKGTAGPGPDVEIAEGRPECGDVAASDLYLEAAGLECLEPAADTAQSPGVLGCVPGPQVAHRHGRFDMRTHRPVMARLCCIHDLERGRITAAELLKVEHVPAAGVAGEEVEEVGDGAAPVDARPNEEILIVGEPRDDRLGHRDADA